MKRYIYLLIVAVIMLLLPMAVQAQPAEVFIEIDGTRLNANGVRLDQNILFPAQPVFEALGFNAHWNTANRSMTLTRGRDTIILMNGTRNFYFNGVAHRLRRSSQFIGGVFMTEMSILTNILGYRYYQPTSARVQIFTQAHQAEIPQTQAATPQTQVAAAQQQQQRQSRPEGSHWRCGERGITFRVDQDSLGIWTANDAGTLVSRGSVPFRHGDDLFLQFVNIILARVGVEPMEPSFMIWVRGEDLVQHDGPAVRIDIAFPNHDQRVVENPNRALAAVMREYAELALELPRPLGMRAAFDRDNISEEQAQWSESFINSLVEALPYDEAILASPISIEGWEKILRPYTVGTYTMIRGERGLGWHMIGGINAVGRIIISTHAALPGHATAFPRPVEDIMHTMGIELFTRTVSLGSSLGNTKVEHITGAERANNWSGSWATYSGFYNRSADIVGLDTILSSAMEGRDEFIDAFDNEKRDQLNENFTFSLGDRYRVMKIMDVISDSMDLRALFVEQTGVSNVGQHLVTMMNRFSIAVDENETPARRNNAARIFDRDIRVILDFAERNGIDDFSSLTYGVHTPVVGGEYRTLFFHPEVGVGPRDMFELLGFTEFVTQSPEDIIEGECEVADVAA